MPLLQTTTAEGALKGMVTARAPHELTDQEVAYLQDAIISQPGFVSRRGAITGTTAITASNLDSERPAAVCSVVDPSGVLKIGVVYLKTAGAGHFDIYLAVFDKNLTFIQKHYISNDNFFSAATTTSVRTMMVQCVPALDGSVLISMRARYDRVLTLASPTSTSKTVKWYGGCPTTALVGGAGLATIACTEGSTAVTGGAAEIAKISFPGVMIHGIGVVATITSTTQVELQWPSLVTQGATATNFSIAETLGVARGRGRVNCSAGALTGVVGYGTMFTEQSERATVGGGNGNGMNLVDATSMKLLAQITSTATVVAPTDTLTGVPATVPRSAALKSYLMFSWQPSVTGQNFMRFTAPFGNYDPSPKSVKGSWWANYKGYMLSFNGLVSLYSGADTGETAVTSRVWIHGPRFPEIMDHSVADGDWFDVQSTKPGDPDGVAIQSGNEAVILCKALETFALRGDTPDDFFITKIADDGALTYEATTSWKGMPIWLGKSGIWMYDNAGGAVNITENTLGTWWRDRVAAFDNTSLSPDSDSYFYNQARCFVYKDYLFVNVANTGFTHTIYTDGVARTQNPLYLMIYLPTMAVSTMTNFNFQGFIQIGRAGYVLLPQLGSTTHHWFPLDNLFTQGAAFTDTILTINSYNSGTLSTSVGPWFHVESRSFDGGDGLWKKTWKQLAIEFNETTTKRMWLETVAGLNATGLRAVLPFVGTSAFKAARVKFRTRDQYMRFRLYEDISNRPATLTLGAWQWGYKFARRGAV
jgi:hypothetical protein